MVNCSLATKKMDISLLSGILYSYFYINELNKPLKY